MPSAVGPVASSLAVCLLLAACGGGAAPSTTASDGTSGARAMPIGSVLVLECAGTPPADTTVTLVAGAARLVALRHPPPEQALFALLEFPANAFKADSGSAVNVTIRPRPGVYGVDIRSDAPFSGVRLTFKYGRHYAAPVAAQQKHGSDMAFERTLAIAWLHDSTAYMFPSQRGASDNLSALVKEQGRYVVAGPK